MYMIGENVQFSIMSFDTIMDVDGWVIPAPNKENAEMHLIRFMCRRMATLKNFEYILRYSNTAAEGDQLKI